MDAGTGAAPFFIVCPLEFLVHGRGHAPPVGEAELGQHGSSSCQAEVVNKILPQDAHGHGVEQECALPCEPDYTTLRIQFEEFLVM